MMLLVGQTTEFNIHLSCPLLPGFSFPLILQVTPFADEVFEIHLEVGRMESCWEEDSEEILLHCLQPSCNLNLSHPNACGVPYVGFQGAIALIGDTRHVMS